jgi:hypothetical protein
LPLHHIVIAIIIATTSYLAKISKAIPEETTAEINIAHALGEVLRDLPGRVIISTACGDA